ncbi:MAG: hypothetical protein CSA81_05770 [Acidobacteria bacterium]|nr:MAG: hypothetical protein CSA81_05770 [Acidobacteriota bacterium]
MKNTNDTHPILFMLAGFLLSATALFGQYDPWAHTEETQNFVKIVKKDNYRSRVDHLHDYVMVEAEGAADPRKVLSQAHARTLALKTARALAYEKLMETVEGLKMTSNTIYKDELLKWSFIVTRVKGMIKNAEVLDENVTDLDDGSVLAKVRLVYRLHGQGGIMMPVIEEMLRSPAVVKERKSFEVNNPPRKKGNSKYTGVLLKIRGLKWDPPEFWKIKTPSSQTVWDTRFVDWEYANTEITYGTWNLFKKDKKLAKKYGRIGDSPLEIKVKQITEAGNLVISEKDALKLRQTNNEFLYENRIAVIYSKK